MEKLRIEHLVFSLYFLENILYRDAMGRVVTRAHTVTFVPVRWYLGELDHLCKKAYHSIHPSLE